MSKAFRFFPLVFPVFGFRQAEKLMKQIGVKNVKLTEYEMSIAAHLVDPLSMHVSNFPAPQACKIPLSPWIALFAPLWEYTGNIPVIIESRGF